jgi:hypothetical protein
MSKLNQTDRRSIAEQLMALGNIVVGGITADRILSQSFSAQLIISGGIILIIFYSLAIMMMRK